MLRVTEEYVLHLAELCHKATAEACQWHASVGCQASGNMLHNIVEITHNVDMLATGQYQHHRAE